MAVPAGGGLVDHRLLSACAAPSTCGLEGWTAARPGGEPEPAHPGDGEAGVAQGGEGVAGGLQPPVNHGQRVASAMRCTSARPAGSARVCSRNRTTPPGRSTRRSSASAATRSGSEHITRHSTAASTLASGSGNDSARPARTLTGSAAARAARTARPRRWGSGSTTGRAESSRRSWQWPSTCWPGSTAGDPFTCLIAGPDRGPSHRVLKRGPNRLRRRRANRRCATRESRLPDAPRGSRARAGAGRRRRRRRSTGHGSRRR